MSFPISQFRRGISFDLLQCGKQLIVLLALSNCAAANQGAEKKNEDKPYRHDKDYCGCSHGEPFIDVRSDFYEARKTCVAFNKRLELGASNFTIGIMVSFFYVAFDSDFRTNAIPFLRRRAHSKYSAKNRPTNKLFVKNASALRIAARSLAPCMLVR